MKILVRPFPRYAGRRARAKAKVGVEHEVAGGKAQPLGEGHGRGESNHVELVERREPARVERMLGKGGSVQYETTSSPTAG